METWDKPKPYLIARIAAAARICLPEIDIAISSYSPADYVWGMRCGANAFTVAFSYPRDMLDLAAGEVNKLKVMWFDSIKIKECFSNNN
jgi:hypothetical protein